MKNSKTKEAVIYCRFSSKMQQDSASIDLQMNACQTYADQNDYTIVGTYSDEAISGTKDSQRKEFMRMIQESGEGRFSIVLVYKYNRFSRNFRMQMHYEDQLNENGVELIAVTENYGDSHQAQLLKMISAWTAEQDVNTISENVLNGQKSRARNCLHTGGKPPLGFQVDPETRRLILSDNPDEVEAIKNIFTLKARGYTLNEISEALDQKGINRSNTGRKISHSTMISILGNEKYMGTFVFNKSAAKNKRGKRNGHQDKDDQEIIRIPNGCPAIVDEAIFNKVQEKLKNGKGNGGRAIAKRMYLLSGLMRCPCGSSYIAHYRNERPGHRAYASYNCGNQRQTASKDCQNRGIEMVTLHESILKISEQFLLNDVKMITHHLNEQRKKRFDDGENTLKNHRRRLGETEKQIKNITNAIAGGLNQPEMLEKLNELSVERASLNGQIEEIEALTESRPVNEEAVKEALSHFQDLMITENNRPLQLALETMIDKIIVYDDHIEATFLVAS